MLSPSSPEPPGGLISPNQQASPEPSVTGTMSRNYQYGSTTQYHQGSAIPYHHGFPRTGFHFERGSPDPSTDRPFSSASSSLGSDRSHEDDVSLITGQLFFILPI